MTNIFSIFCFQISFSYKYLIALILMSSKSSLSGNFLFPAAEDWPVTSPALTASDTNVRGTNFVEIMLEPARDKLNLWMSAQWTSRWSHVLNVAAENKSGSWLLNWPAVFFCSDWLEVRMCWWASVPGTVRSVRYQSQASPSRASLSSQLLSALCKLKV